MKSVSLVLILVFFFSEVASATTCDLLDGAYVEASDGTYLGFFGAGSASTHLASTAPLLVSTASETMWACMVQTLASIVPIIVFP